MKKNSWDGIFSDGEKLLWQGQPKSRLAPRPGQIMESLFGLVFMGFSVIWMRTAYAMSVGPHWAFGLIFFGIGFYQVAGKYLWQSYERGHTWYSLSNRNAYIASDTPLGGRKLRTWPITAKTPVEYERDPCGAVYFGSETYYTNGRKRTARVGFENLENIDEVIDLFTKIRKGQV